MKNANMNACKMAHEIKKNTGCDLSTAFKTAYKLIKAASKKTTFTRRDLDKIFTELVSKYIAKGLMIRTCDMGGSQGEIAHVDLTDGTDVIRILMTSNSTFGVRDYVDTAVTIMVGMSDVKNKDVHATVWNNRLTAIEEYTWYKIDEDWFVTEEEVPAIQAKREVRWANRWEARCRRNASVEYTSEEAKEIILKFVRKQKGFKTAKVSDITKAFRDGKKVYITVKGKPLVIG